MELKVRPPAVAGTFYPRDTDKLSRMINELSHKAANILTNKKPAYKKIKGLILPHASYVYSGIVAATGYNLLSKQKLTKPKIVLIGPSHHAYFRGVAAANFERWQTPLGLVLVDTLNKQLIQRYSNSIVINNEVHSPEHCLEVQLPFLQTIFPEFSIIPLLTGDNDEKMIANILAGLSDSYDLVIVSSDLSHYLPYQEAIVTDQFANQAIANLNLNNINNIDACGISGIKLLVNLAQLNRWHGELIYYANSGDTAGDKSAVVGYSCYIFTNPD